MKKIILLALIMSAFAILFACGGSQSQTEGPLENPGDTPTEAYKRLFAAVKSKNTESIKQELSQKTQALAAAQAEMQKVPIEKVYENGFVAPNMAPSLPEIRDERVKERMGAIEVWNSKDSRWEDLPYIREKTGWKLAVGDVFAGTHKFPGKGLAALERDAANAASGNQGLKRIEPSANSSAGNRQAATPANK